MDRETPLLIAVVMLSLAALSICVSGWVLLARDRRLGSEAFSGSSSNDVSTVHPEGHDEES